MTAPLNRPALIELEEDQAADPGLEAPVADLLPQGRAMQAVARVSARRMSGLSRLAIWVFGTLFGFVVSVAAWDFVTNLLNRDSLLGWVAMALVGGALLVAVLLALRELAAFARMTRIDSLRQKAVSARLAGDLAAARATVAALKSLYKGRAVAAWGLARFDEQQAEIFDADALLGLAETEILGPLDKAALTEIETAARQVATVTALVPIALADVATALFANLRMIRRLSQLYGGRSSTLGNLSLLRRVFSALLGAGAIALADDLIGSFASGGILAKLSRRFGEGVVNGALTARVGLAAMEACRPLPFAALEKPGTTATISRALAGYLNRAKAESDEPRS